MEAFMRIYVNYELHPESIQLDNLVALRTRVEVGHLLGNISFIQREISRVAIVPVQRQPSVMKYRSVALISSRSFLPSVPTRTRCAPSWKRSFFTKNPREVRIEDGGVTSISLWSKWSH